MADPPSPTLEAVHSAATASKRFESWLKRACKNYKALLDFEAVVNHAVRRERLEELTGEDKEKFYDVLEEFDRLQDLLAKFLESKAYEDFRSWSHGEELIKWVGKERVSVGYCGLWERGREYWLMDIPLEYELPFEKTVKDLFEVYRVGYLMPVPTQEEAERNLLEFLGYVKPWPRERLVWVLTNLYPLSDETGGFYSVVKNVLALPSLRKGWEDVIGKWTREITDELKRTAQFAVLKSIFKGEYEAETYIEREIIPKLKEEFLEKYGETTKDPAWVRAALSERALEFFLERTPVETKIVEVYEQIKPLIPAEKAQLTKAGLHEAIRWAFLHPEMSVEAFASGHVFPLGFTTEEAMAIASKVMEKVGKKPPVAPPPPKPPVPEVKLGTVEFLVDREIGSYVKIHPETKAYFEAVKGEVLAEALRRVPERVRKDFEEATAKGISYLESDAFKSASHEVLLVVSSFGEKAPPPPPTPRPALKELTKEEVAKLEDIFKATLSAAGLYPPRYMSEFRVEMDAVKWLPFAEARDRIEALAKEIIARVPPSPPAVAVPPMRVVPRGLVTLEQIRAEEAEIERHPRFEEYITEMGFTMTSYRVLDHLSKDALRKGFREWLEKRGA